MSTQVPLVERICRLSDDELLDFLAALWERAGWQVDTEAGDRREVVAARTIDGEHDRVLVRAFPVSDSVTVDEIHAATARRDFHDVIHVSTVSLTGYTRDAREVADVYDVDTLDSASIARIVVALGADDLLE